MFFSATTYAVSLPFKYSCERILVPSLSLSIPLRLRYITTPLLEKYVGEHLKFRIWGKDTIVPTTHYLTKAEREAHKLEFIDGKIYQNGKLFDTSGAHYGNAGIQSAKFVMDDKGNFYAKNDHDPGYFHHSGFLAGGPVAAAGEIQAIQGVLVYISDFSNHYKPSRVYTYQAIEQLMINRVDLENVNIVFHIDPHFPIVMPSLFTVRLLNEKELKFFLEKAISKIKLR